LAVLLGALVAIPSATVANSDIEGGYLEVNFRVGEIVVKTVALPASENGEAVFIPPDALPTEEEIAKANPEGRVLGWIEVQDDSDESGDTLDSRIRGNDSVVGESGNDIGLLGNDSVVGESGNDIGLLGNDSGVGESGNDIGLLGNDSGVRTEYTADAELIASGAYADITAFAVTGDGVCLAVGVPGDSSGEGEGSEAPLSFSGTPPQAEPENPESGNALDSRDASRSGMTDSNTDEPSPRVDGDSNTDEPSPRVDGDSNTDEPSPRVVGFSGFAASGGPKNDSAGAFGNDSGIGALGGLISPLGASDDITALTVSVSPTSFQTYTNLDTNTEPSELTVGITPVIAESYTAGGTIELPLNFTPSSDTHPNFTYGTDGTDGVGSSNEKPFFALNAASIDTSDASIIKSYSVDTSGSTPTLVLTLKSNDEYAAGNSDTAISGAKMVTVRFDFNNAYNMKIPVGTTLWTVQANAYVGADLAASASPAVVSGSASHELTFSISYSTPVDKNYISGAIISLTRTQNYYYYESDFDRGYANRVYVEVPTGSDRS
jgi:hypothetical protein